LEIPRFEYIELNIGNKIHIKILKRSYEVDIDRYMIQFHILPGAIFNICILPLGVNLNSILVKFEMLFIEKVTCKENGMT